MYIASLLYVPPSFRYAQQILQMERMARFHYCINALLRLIIQRVCILYGVSRERICLPPTFPHFLRLKQTTLQMYVQKTALHLYPRKIIL